MARDRSIALRVRADVADAVRGLQDVGRAAGEVGSKSEQAGRQSQSLGQRVVSSARDQSAAWTTVGSALTTYGAAVTGLGGLVLATGINYNSLRQTATAALTSVTGSTEGAAEQMRRLDDYGQNSWLMRDTLIRAQQQMTGFGISTERVIPYMDALSEAVAATGGNNETFEELALVMGQIQSQGRITARELDRFGVRGVDAAQMIGDAMGMTAGEIREQITAGALDAETALEALAQGMMMNFEGSSDLVRNTFRGAFDDVKAAFRDLAAVIASPLVNPEGGGLLVDLMNWASEALYAIQGLPAPLLQVGGALAGLTGPLALAAGGFMLMAPRIVATYDALGELGVWGGRAQSALRGVARVLPRLLVGGAVIGGLSMLVGKLAEVATSGSPAAASVDEVRLALARMDQIGDLDEMFAFGGDVQDLDSALRILTSNDVNSWMERLGSGLADVVPGFKNVHNPVREAREQFEATGQALAGLVEDGNADLAALQFDRIAEAAARQGISTDELLDLMPGYADALARVATESELAGGASGDMADGLGEVDPAAAEAAAALEELEANLRSARESFIDWSSTLNSDEYSLSSWLDDLEAQNAALRDWDSNMMALVDAGASPALLAQLEALGVDGAQAVHDLANGTEEDLDRANAAAEEAAGLLEGVGLEYDALSGRDPVELGIDIDPEPAQGIFEGITSEWDDHNITPDLDLDSEPAQLVFNEETQRWEDATAVTGLDLDPSDAIHVFDEETGSWTTTTSTTLLDLDPDTAVRVFNTETGDWETTTSTTLLDLNPHLANQEFGGVTKTWGNTLTDTRLGADPTSAQGTYGSTMSGWANNTTYTNLGANTTSARASVSGFTAWVRGLRPTVTVTAKTLGPSLKGALATGGPVHGVGSETSDSNLYALSVNEHVLSAREVRGLGGHGAVEQMRAMARAGGDLRAALTGAAGVRGFAGGGTPAYRYMPQPAPPAVASAQAAGPAVATLDPEDRALLRAVASRPVEVRMGRRMLAEATAVAGEYGRSRGQGRG